MVINSRYTAALNSAPIAQWIEHRTTNARVVGSIPTWRTIIKTEGDQTMSENYIVINGKRAELTEEQLNKLGIELPNNERWRAKKHEKYYYINCSNLICSTDQINDYYDDFRYYSHNYFQTKEDAEKYARVLETEMLLRKYADEHNDDMPWDNQTYHWTLAYNSVDSCIEIESWLYMMRHQTVYFSSREIAARAIKEVGRERIIDYLTYEW